MNGPAVMARFMAWIGERWGADFDAWLKAYEMSRRQLEVL
jgi:hypothetical protein